MLPFRPQTDIEFLLPRSQRRLIGADETSSIRSTCTALSCLSLSSQPPQALSRPPPSLLPPLPFLERHESVLYGSRQQQGPRWRERPLPSRKLSDCRCLSLPCLSADTCCSTPFVSRSFSECQRSYTTDSIWRARGDSTPIIADSQYLYTAMSITTAPPPPASILPPSASTSPGRVCGHRRSHSESVAVCGDSKSRSVVRHASFAGGATAEASTTHAAGFSPSVTVTDTAACSPPLAHRLSLAAHSAGEDSRGGGGSRSLFGLSLSGRRSAAVVETQQQSLTAEPAPMPGFVETGGGRSLIYGLDGYFPRPRAGQSLQAFLASHEFRRNVAQLDRENAHFRISESLIAAFEMVADASSCPCDSSSSTDRCWRPESRDNPGHGTNCSALSVPEVSFSVGSFDCDTTERDRSADVADSCCECFDVSGGRLNPNTSATAAVGVAGTLPTLPSGSLNCAAASVASAHQVALSLLAGVDEGQLPRACELPWLVHDDRVPHSLLPAPSSYRKLMMASADASCQRQHSCDIDDGGGGGMLDSSSDDKLSGVSIALRGTDEWAPPRPQIIFSLHRQERMCEVMCRQQYRCAGCGLKVPPRLAYTFRHCDYLGRYFCTSCHRGHVFYIPARIIHKYDYDKYPVSVFAHQLLRSMWRDPLFHVDAVNAAMLAHVSRMAECRRLRLQLRLAGHYVTQCRFSAGLLRKHPMPASYLTDELDLYSLSDLVAVQQGHLVTQLRVKFHAYQHHCLSCQLCRGRAFLCQRCVLVTARASPPPPPLWWRLVCAACCCSCWWWCCCVRQLCGGRGHSCLSCRRRQPIFPFQTPAVQQCGRCGACYHADCLPASPDQCLRCRRLARRQLAN